MRSNKKPIKMRNAVARFAQRSGAGTPVSKRGKLAPRNKIKQLLLKELKTNG